MGDVGARECEVLDRGDTPCAGRGNIDTAGWTLRRRASPSLGRGSWR